MARSQGAIAADAVSALADLLDAWRDKTYDRRATAIEVISKMQDNGHVPEIDLESLLFRELLALAKRRDLLDLKEIADL